MPRSLHLHAHARLSVKSSGSYRDRYSQAIHSKANGGPNKSRAQRSRDNRASKRSPTLGGRKVYGNIKVQLRGHAEDEGEYEIHLSRSYRRTTRVANMEGPGGPTRAACMHLRSSSRRQESGAYMQVIGAVASPHPCGSRVADIQPSLVPSCLEPTHGIFAWHEGQVPSGGVCRAGSQRPPIPGI